MSTIPEPDVPLVVRLHDESYDAELFGSHASTGRQWLVYGIEECVRAAQVRSLLVAGHPTRER